MAPKSSTIFSFLLLFLFLVLLLLPMSASPFGFIQNLQGCKLGDQVQGIHMLKKYLEQFGYVSHPMNQFRSTDDDDYFDSLLQSAIKSYQNMHHLKPTGNLDPETVSEMMKPRCGVADIIRRTSRMQYSSKKMDDHSHGSLHAVAHYDFFPGSPRWPASDTHLTYAFLHGTPDEAKEPVSQAFKKWASATSFRFSRTEDLGKANLTINFNRFFHGDGNPFDGPGGTIAHAYAPTDGRLHYDADERWAVGAVVGALDVETVALHEIGHLLGLGHSSIKEAIMFPTISAGVTKDLHQDDIEGIKALYKA